MGVNIDDGEDDDDDDVKATSNWNEKLSIFFLALYKLKKNNNKQLMVDLKVVKCIWWMMNDDETKNKK